VIVKGEELLALTSGGGVAFALQPARPEQTRRPE
jgi:hypothetical protein